MGVSECRRVPPIVLFLDAHEPPPTPIRPYADPCPLASLRDADLIDGQPGDKSPGYYRVSLRDEMKPAFKCPTMLLTFIRNPKPDAKRREGDRILSELGIFKSVTV
jgi:hypothetical protein